VYKQPWRLLNIHLDKNDSSESLFLSRDLERRSIINGAIEGQLSGITNWSINPKESAEFLIGDLVKDEVARLADRRVRFSVSWRRGSVTWLWQLADRTASAMQAMQLDHALRPVR
jgi:hypothetical protein